MVLQRVPTWQFHRPSPGYTSSSFGTWPEETAEARAAELEAKPCGEVGRCLRSRSLPPGTLDLGRKCLVTFLGVWSHRHRNHFNVRIDKGPCLWLQSQFIALIGAQSVFFQLPSQVRGFLAIAIGNEKWDEPFGPLKANQVIPILIP